MPLFLVKNIFLKYKVINALEYKKHNASNAILIIKDILNHLQMNAYVLKDIEMKKETRLANSAIILGL